MKKCLKTNRKGFTLLEVLVAVFVLAIVALPLLNVFVFNTTLVRRMGEKDDTTYAAQAVMEELQPLGYGQLYGAAPLSGTKGSYSIHSVTRTVSIDRIPYGSFSNLVSGKACYAHLIINGGTATFTGPDGVMRQGLSYASGVSVTSTTATIGGSAIALNKPAGTNLVLIVNAGKSAIASLNISMAGADACVLYALSPQDANVQNITIGGGNSREYRKYNSKTGAEADPPPRYLLVNAVCRVYGADGSTVESMVQNTLEVDLP